MSDLVFPTYNDEPQSWANIAVDLSIYDGPTIEDLDISAISDNVKVEVGEQRMPGGGLRGRTVGSAKWEAKMTLYKSGAKRLYKALVQVARAKGFMRANMPRFGLVKFDVPVAHTPVDAAQGEIEKILYKGCRILGDTRDMKEGNDADTVEIDLNPQDVWFWIDNGWAVLL